MKELVLQEIEAADMILIGLGEEFDQRSQLLKNENYKNTYEFFEVSQKKEDKPKIKSAVLEEKRFIEQDNGEFIRMTYPELFEELKDYYPPEVIKEVWDNAKEEI